MGIVTRFNSLCIELPTTWEVSSIFSNRMSHWDFIRGFHSPSLSFNPRLFYFYFNSCFKTIDLIIKLTTKNLHLAANFFSFMIMIIIINNYDGTHIYRLSFWHYILYNIPIYSYLCSGAHGSCSLDRLTNFAQSPWITRLIGSFMLIFWSCPLWL